GGRGRPADRGPQQPRQGPLRRRPEPLPRAVRPLDGRAPDHRPRARAHPAPGAGARGVRPGTKEGGTESTDGRDGTTQVGANIGRTRRCRVRRSPILGIGKVAVVLACAIALPAVAADGVELLAPSHGTTLLLRKGVPITFTWKADSGPPQYRFQLSLLSDFKDLLVDRELAQTSTVVRELGAGRY